MQEFHRHPKKGRRHPDLIAVIRDLLTIFGLLSFLTVGCLALTTPPTPTPPPHRGAARQMYGSGSLRPPGSNPNFGQRQQGGGRSPASPPSSSSHGQRNPPPKMMLPRPQYPLVPLPIPNSEWEKFPGGFPFYIPAGVSKTRSRLNIQRSGKYGGRPEYPNGRPNHGSARARYPFDYGFLGGRGFYKIPREQDMILERYHPVQGFNFDHSSKMRLEDEEGAPEEMHERPCECGRGEFLCIRSCMCIDNTFRCDGDIDCEGEEDELECGELEITTESWCKETENHVRCQGTGGCINKDWLCDGDNDCGDFSDETRCGFSVNCTIDQFECANGLCIQKSWLCDNDNDCKDYSDEFNCTKAGCTDDEFTCADGSCISLSWKCDRQLDCKDGTDESECDFEPPVCNTGEFQCTFQKCIKIEFKCDGDNDCEDWSDEDDCPKIQGSCVSGEFKCNSGKCIPEKYKCDKQQDCEDNEDESNCDTSVTQVCSPDEYTCKSGACILRTWVCDGVSDCAQNEDENQCEIVCDESKFPCIGAGVNETQTEFCINKKHVCDGQKDCPKGEDEKDCPTDRECEENSKCAQKCITLADGKKGCTCLPGYILAADGFSCEDINECMYEIDPVCSQTCNNTIGSFQCGCMTGYILRPDLRSCKALGGHPTLLFANRIDIRQVSLQVSASSSRYTAILKGLHNAISLDYHYEKGLIFWSDVSIDVIRRAYINGTGITDVIKWGLESPGGVALDWIHNLLFWTDSGTRRIEVASLDGKQRAIVAANELDKPRAIVVHPGEALVFWTDWGPSPKIERAEMDGRNRRSIITESVFWPNGLTLDYTTSRIYWADAKHNVIETALFDGSDRKKVISKGLPHPFALTIFEDAIYWTDWHTKSISTANKATGAGLLTIHSNLHFPMDIHSYHPQRQPKFKNHCGTNNGGCDHLCLPNKKSFSCVCLMGQKLKSDGRSCEKPDKLLLFARKKDLRIKHLDKNAAHQHEMVIPVDGIKSAVALAWDAKTDTIFWTDVERDTINRAFWNGSNQEVLVDTNILSPAGLAFDWITDKLYWTDAGTAHIEVSNIDGSMRTLLVWSDLDKPRDIVVDPLGGYMYWSDWGDTPKIERAAMDGSTRMVLISKNLTWPNGLAIDHDAGKLYWADGGTKSIEYSNLDGSNRKVLIEGPDLPHPFGLDVFEDNIYWTDWQTLNIESANKKTGLNRTVLGTSIIGLMDVRVFHRKRKTIKNPCANKNGGCSHVCLLKPKGHSCACPTGIKLGDNGKTCPNGPKNFLIMAHRVDIRQISLDVPYISDVILPFGQLKHATSVDVDRKTGEIYWTDSAEDFIQKSTPDGKEMKLIVENELQTPDGIAIDSTGRKIYWTDGERNSIEVAELDGTNRKVLIWSDLDNPRAITLHYHHGLIFWSDWGKYAKIEVAYMDGTNRKPLITKKLVWPNGLTIDRPANRLYWNDGKLNTIESSNLNGKDRKLIITDVPHPYGLVVVGNHIYWTDWQTQGLHRAEKITGSDRTKIISNLSGLMDVRSVQSDNIAENACGENNGGCSNLCLRNPSSFTCACPTGVLMSKENSKKCEIQPSTYLLIATRFSLTRISLDTEELWEVTLPIPDVRNAIDVDYHWEKQLLYFTDIEKHVIASVNMKNLSEVTDVIYANLSSPDGVAVDWIADNIYWTNTGNKVVEVARLDGSSRKVIVKENLHDPRSIAVFPKKGYLFWTDWGDPKIERAYLDGSNRKTIINTDISFPLGLAVDYSGKRLYWVDTKLHMERIETSDLHGRNRIQLNIQATHPFALTQIDDFIYWTDWVKKSIIRADKSTGKNAVEIRSNLKSAMGITVVAESRQKGWNPCAVNNGGCSHLCFFKLKNYTCECPDDVSEQCSEVPNSWVLNKCPPESHKCDLEEDDDDADQFLYHPVGSEFDDMLPEHHDEISHHIIMILIPIIVMLLMCFVIAIVFLYLKGKKKYLYATGRSFSNPNYYTSTTDANNSANNVDKKQFIWKRLKYDKSQERVYEETTGNSSPEVASLIPAVLTPSSSHCETVTPDMERSPSVTPLRRLDSIQPVA